MAILYSIDIKFLFHKGTSSDKKGFFMIGISLKFETADINEIVNIDLISI